MKNDRLRLAISIVSAAACAASPAAHATPSGPLPPPPAAADNAADWSQRAEQLVRHAATTVAGLPAPLRVQVQLGHLDPRLRLAPCQQVDVYLPAGHRAWGSTRVGLRCVSGPTRWNVFLPMTVRVFAPAVQAGSALPAGTVLVSEQLQMAEADWAAVDSPAFREPAAVVGRTLQRPVAAGGTLRESDLKRRQWFAIGDIVRVVAVGAGFTVTADGVALTPGVEGQSARVRTDGGRVVSGTATGDRRLAVPL